MGSEGGHSTPVASRNVALGREHQRPESRQEVLAVRPCLVPKVPESGKIAKDCEHWMSRVLPFPMAVEVPFNSACPSPRPETETIRPRTSGRCCTVVEGRIPPSPNGPSVD